MLMALSVATTDLIFQEATSIGSGNFPARKGNPKFIG